MLMVFTNCDVYRGDDSDSGAANAGGGGDSMSDDDDGTSDCLCRWVRVWTSGRGSRAPDTT